MARPRKEIDMEKVKRMCGIMCTAEEVASVLEISVDTLDRRLKEEFDCGYAEFFKRYSGTGKVSLRRWQFEAAKKGSNAMLIWLGKQYLGQTDKSEIYSKDPEEKIKDSLKMYD